MASPQLILIAGPNGSGKSTSAPVLVPATTRFLNADDIARTVHQRTDVERNVHAGRLLLDEWDRLVAANADFAIETTLSSRSLAPRIVRMREAGYQFQRVFVWLESVDLAIERVAERVRQGGHDIPEAVIRRRYLAGARNLFSLYIPITDTWRVFDNTRLADMSLVATGGKRERTLIYNPVIWQNIVQAGQP